MAQTQGLSVGRERQTGTGKNETIEMDASERFSIQYIARLQSARVDQAVLEDVIDSYASTCFDSPAERDRFLNDTSEPPLGPQLKKAIVDVILCVTAAAEVPTAHVYQRVIDLLGVGDNPDQLIRDVQRVLLKTMIDEGEVTLITSDLEFQSRLDWVKSERLSG